MSQYCKAQQIQQSVLYTILFNEILDITYYSVKDKYTEEVINIYDILKSV